MRQMLRDLGREVTRTVCHALVIACAAGALAACDGLLDSSRPSSVDADLLNDPSKAGLLLNGVVADFDCAHGAFVAAAALMGDELEDAQLGAAIWDYDRRTFNANSGGQYGVGACNAQLFGVYTPLSVARWAADSLIARLDAWTDQQVDAANPNRRREMIGIAAIYAGFSLTELGMIMCSAAIDLGPEINSTRLFQQADARFTRAIDIANAVNRADIRVAALAGRARVRLYLGQLAAASADARQVPAGFVLNASAADDPAGRRYNRIVHFVNFSRYHIVEAQSRNLTTGGQPDPRARSVLTTARAVDGRLSVQQTKYTSLASSLPITRYEEALLIIAEAEGGTAAVNIINALRARYNLPPVSAAEQANMPQTIIEERRRELWLEGQRLYDLNRFQLPLVPALGASFLKGGTYGPARCLPLPDVERFNNRCILNGDCPTTG